MVLFQNEYGGKKYKFPAAMTSMNFFRPGYKKSSSDSAITTMPATTPAMQ